MRRIMIVFMLLIGAIFLISACGDSAANSENVDLEYSTTDVIDYGNGVYYFPHTNHSFGNALSSFINANSELELTALTVNIDDDGEGEDGYFAVFRHK